jgi:hypothetical protein
MLFGWLPRDPSADAAPTVASMARALRASTRQRGHSSVERGFAIGTLGLASYGDGPSNAEPARAGDRYSLWMVGEAFEWPSGGGTSATQSQMLAFRQRLLAAYLDRGPAALRDLDGEYHVAIWDRSARRLAIFNDRFGALPLYWTCTPAGVAFAGGVRGVLLAPGVRIEPDTDAITEAVTFGGFRLGTRTNVRDVSMLPGSSVLSADGARAGVSRYWSWSEIPAGSRRPIDDVVSELRHEWTRAVSARLEGAVRPGLTLSGGLDSRAILAESVRHGRIHAVTYGVPESDDVRIARRAARAAGAEWTLHPLYDGSNPGWLDRRVAHIQATDGLVDLVDLMHVEAIDDLCAHADLNLSGYIGDAVTGPTFNDVSTPEAVVLALPYYGGVLGMEWGAALERITPLVNELGPARARFALFEHKLPQSTNRITAALRPHIRVRRPFVDYRVFELAQSQPAITRGADRLHERWLRSTYPACFGRIPHQKTGVPPLTPEWRRVARRAARYAWRRGLGALAAAGAPVVDSISCEVFGRDRVKNVVDAWFERLAAPTQVIGALFVYETYHRDLAATLRSARAVQPEETCSSAVL